MLPNCSANKTPLSMDIDRSTLVHSKVLRRGLVRTRSVSASPRLRSPPRSHLLRSKGKKICALRAAWRSGCVFALELGRLTSILLARTASGRPRTSISEAETAVFSTFFRSTSARRKKRPMYSKPQFFLGFFILRNVRASAENVQNRSASTSDCVWRRERGLRASWELSQRILERLCGGLGAVFDGS